MQLILAWARGGVLGGWEVFLNVAFLPFGFSMPLGLTTLFMVRLTPRSRIQLAWGKEMIKKRRASFS